MVKSPLSLLHSHPNFIVYSCSAKTTNMAEAFGTLRRLGPMNQIIHDSDCDDNKFEWELQFWFNYLINFDQTFGQLYPFSVKLTNF